MLIDFNVLGSLIKSIYPNYRKNRRKAHFWWVTKKSQVRHIPIDFGHRGLNLLTKAWTIRQKYENGVLISTLVVKGS